LWHDACLACEQNPQSNSAASNAMPAMQVDRVNPIAAADLAECLADWDMLDEEHQQLMKQQLRRLAGTKGLSEEVREIVEDALDEGSSRDSSD
jgi:hypothetical protein